MTFLQLYGVELDRELGSNKTDLFTNVRRKAAINAAQREFVKRTECLQRQLSIALVSGTREYDIEAAAADFAFIAKEGVSIEITEGSTVRYIEGDDLEETSVQRLNTEEPGWRATTASTPQWRYIRRDGGRVYLGLTPAPSFTTGTWVALVPIVLIPTDMVDDADVPFTYSGNALGSLAFYHRALAYFGASDLEEFRKDTQRQGLQLQKWEAEILKYEAEQKPKRTPPIRLTRNYRRRISGSRIARVVDPGL